MFITIPSTSSTDLYPNNKVSQFTVQLPKEIDLDGSYEVALTEIFYPHSWFNFELQDRIWLYYRNHGVSATATLQEGSYPSAKHLIEELMRELALEFRINKRKVIETIRRVGRGRGTEADELVVKLGRTEEGVTRTKIDFNLVFNTHTQLIQLKTDSIDSTITFSPRLAQILGFDTESFREKGLYVGTRLVDMTRINAIYIYCDLVEPRIVGDTLAPLLSVIPAETDKTGKNVWIRYTKLQYQPVVKRSFSQLEISLRDETGELVRFRKGKVIVTLHLRRQRLDV